MVAQPGGRVQFRTRSRLAVRRESSDDPAALPPQPRTARSLCATGCCPAATWAACLRRAVLPEAASILVDADVVGRAPGPEEASEIKRPHRPMLSTTLPIT